MATGKYKGFRSPEGERYERITALNCFKLTQSVARYSAAISRY